MTQQVPGTSSEPATLLVGDVPSDLIDPIPPGIPQDRTERLRRDLNLARRAPDGVDIRVVSEVVSVWEES